MSRSVYRNDALREITYPPDAKRSLYSMLEFGARHATNKAQAILYYNKSISYGDLLEQVQACAAGLYTLGVRKGDHITIFLPNIPQCVVAVYAVNRLGAVANLVHPLSTKSELAYAVTLTESRYILATEINEGHCTGLGAEIIRCKTAGYFPQTLKGVILRAGLAYSVRKYPRAANVIEWTDLMKNGRLQMEAGNGLPDDTGSPDDTAAIMYTGGTTGQPKGVMLTNGAINFTATWLINHYANTDAHIGDALLAILPVFHAFGLAVVIHVPLSAGLRILLIPRFNPKECAKLAVKEKVSYLAGVPVIYERMYPFLKDHDCSFVKHAVCGGDKVTADLLNRYNALLKDETGRLKFQPGYGLTESCGSCAVTKMDYTEFIDGSVGTPFSGMEYCLVEPGTTDVLLNDAEGEICFRGPSIMQGYYKNEAATKDVMRKHDDGKIWLHTGDVVTLAGGDTIVFRSRYKRMVKINGINVYPTLIENTMENCPFIREVCAVAVPWKNDRRIKLYVTLKDPAADHGEASEKIMEYARNNLNHWSTPFAVSILDAMPLTKMNKTDYRVLEKRG
ncbi:MAG: class I adenylate-forming enzyme family protein [Methanocorpusculum sp.]|nr:class I adenylate-forming enzyme family protein [Methanocorpusculum sp.]